MTNATRPTEKQTAFIKKLVQEREAGDEIDWPSTTGEASALIGWLLKQPMKPQAKAEAITEDGMYIDRENVQIYKVQFNKAQGSGQRLYAKRLEVDDLGNGDFKVRFEYAAGAVRNIRPEWKMTLEEAEAFGQLYGVCVRCGRDLTREESIARAMGPVCAGKFL